LFFDFAENENWLVCVFSASAKMTENCGNDVFAFIIV
jgi:hypothetical protein